MANDVIIRPPINPIQPGAYSGIDASALSGADSETTSPIVAILGTALGGTPNTPLYFRGPGPLKQVLRGGPLYDAARFAFSGGTARVAAVRIGNSVAQNFLALAGATLTPIKLTALDYGTWTAGVKVTVAANNLITITYTDALGIVYTETFNLGSGATAQQVADAINGKTPGINGSQWVSAAVQSGTMPLTVAAAAPLAGGSDGLVPIASDWTTGLTVLETEPVAIVVPASGDATVHAQVLTHCLNMSTSLARHERTTVVGGVLGETPVTAAARATGALRSSRLQLVYPGIQEFDASGTLVSYDPFYTAAKVAGMHAGADDEATALTHAIVPTVDVERRLSSVQGGDLDVLLQAGVTPIAPRNGGGFWIVDSLSTYNLDLTYRDFHKQRSADVFAQMLRTTLETKYVGSKNLAGQQAAIQTDADQVSQDATDQELIRGFQTSVVTPGSNGNTYNVSVPVMLVDTTKFVFINVVLQPSSTVSRDAGTTADDVLA